METGQYRFETLTNSDSVHAVLQALRQAAQTAEGLKLANVAEEEMRARLDELDATIPPVRGVFAPSPPPLVDEAVTAIRESHDLARATGSAIDRAKRRVRALRGY
jgi:hypothetical protein